MAFWIFAAIQWVSVASGVFAFLHALSQKAEAYSAADRRTKPIWMLITGVATLAMALFGFDFGTIIIFVPAVTAVLVYLVDVRPKLIEVQRGGSSW